ncbi:MAG: hypothetical protein WD066_00625 [Planctomycetaceae bacterium]
MISLLSEKFVPLAVDQHVERRRRDVEGEFFRKVLEQAGRRPDGEAQGLYAFDAEGRLLAFANTLSNQGAKRILRNALAKFDPEAEISPIEDAPKKDARWVLEPPEGATILDVTAKVPGGFQLNTGRRVNAAARESLGRDRMWILADEVEALGRGEMPEALRRRIARFHLVDNTRGQSINWNAEDVRSVEMRLVEGELVGRAHLESPNGDRGYVAALRGVIKTGGDGLETFDVVAEGEFWGRAFSADRTRSREKYPLAVTFRVSKLECEAARVAPGACRGSGLRRYLDA